MASLSSPLIPSSSIVMVAPTAREERPMLLYLGSGAALAAYRRRRRIRALDDCARACDRAARHRLARLAAVGPDRAGPDLVPALALDCLAFCSLLGGLLA